MSTAAQKEDELKKIQEELKWVTIKKGDSSTAAQKENELKKIQEELEWVAIKGGDSKKTPRKILDILIPIGSIVTVGVLCRGLYFLGKRDSTSQQKYMRFRVLSQGVTIVLAGISLFGFSKYK